MFEQAIEFSEAFRQGAGRMRGSLIPALMGCPHCRAVRMIAAPALGTCATCRDDMRVLGAAEI